MKEIFDRQAERLTPEERRVIWEKVSGARRAVGRFGWLRPIPAFATAAVAVVAAVFVLTMPRGEDVMQRSALPRAARPATRAESPSGARPLSEVVRGAVERAPAPRPPALRAQARTPLSALTRMPVAPRRDGVETRPAPVAVGATPEPAAAPSRGMLTGRVLDRYQQPVPYANVIVLGTRQGAQADENGNYVLSGVPVGEAQVRAQSTGHDPVEQHVTISGKATSTLDFTMAEQKVVKELPTIEVSALKRMDTKSSATKQTITADRLKEIPVDNLREAAERKAGRVAQGGQLHFRGGRSNEVRFQFDGVPTPPATPPATLSVAPPVVQTTGGTKLPNDEPFDSMFFQHYGVNPFIATDEDSLSTFAVDVDNASYTVARRYLELGHLPPAAAVRVEEFVNYFPQGYPRFEDDDFRILVDGAPSPFGSGYHLLRVGLKAREIGRGERKPAQLTFVVDVSGSMLREDRLELVKRALRLLVDELRAGDRVGLVVYGTQGRVLFEPSALAGGGRERLLAAIEALHPEGSTNAEEGLRLGYDMARRGYRSGAINRIVLCSDGVANVGVTGPQSILERVRTEADRGVQLTTVGFGMGNYNDVLMEQLADRGDGNHYYVDDLGEAERVFVENLTGTLQTVARDAKVQVEFDPTRVLRYRLIGFENRDVADRDFRNDKVDAGEIGGGHEVTALYEVKLAKGIVAGPIATVRLRYALPERDGAGAPRVREIARRFDAAWLHRSFETAPPRFRLDAAVAEFAEILRGSYWARDGRLADVLAVARSAAAALADAPSAEFVRLVEGAAALKPAAKAGNGE
jgi:Ca-activated chloride channel homolog